MIVYFRFLVYERCVSAANSGGVCLLFSLCDSEAVEIEMSAKIMSSQFESTIGNIGRSLV